MVLNLLQEVLFLLDYQHTCLKMLNAVSHETDRKYKLLTFKLVKKIQEKLRRVMNKTTNTLPVSQEVVIKDEVFDRDAFMNDPSVTVKSSDVEMPFCNIRPIDKRRLQRVIITAPANMSKIKLLNDDDDDESCANNDELNEAVLDKELKQIVVKKEDVNDSGFPDPFVMKTDDRLQLDGGNLDGNNSEPPHGDLDKDMEPFVDDSGFPEPSAMETDEEEDLDGNNNKASQGDLDKGMEPVVNDINPNSDKDVINEVHDMLQEEVIEKDHKIIGEGDQKQNKNLEEEADVNIEERIQKFCENAFKIKVGLPKDGQSPKLEMIKLKEKCVTCNEMVKVEELEEHMGTHLVYKCDVCFEKFSSHPAVRSHIKNVHLKPPVIIRCDKCDIEFASRSLLRTHNIETHELKCEVCNKVYKNPYYMERHKRFAHEKKPPVQCEICNKTASSKSNLWSHMQTHKDKDSYKCKKCDKRFSTMRGLREHDKHKHHTHTDQTQFTCEFCKHVFSNKWNLVTHRRIHTGEKPFICDICGASFIQKVELKLHNRKHAPNTVQE